MSMHPQEYFNYGTLNHTTGAQTCTDGGKLVLDSITLILMPWFQTLIQVLWQLNDIINPFFLVHAHWAGNFFKLLLLFRPDAEAWKKSA